MRINFVMLFISLAIAALGAFGFYSGNSEETFQWLITIGSGVFIFVTLSGITSIGFNERGGTGNLRVLSMIFFILAIISNLAFCFITITTARYVIVHGILFLLYILIAYSIVKALK
jgi:hypothetical protein